MRVIRHTSMRKNPLESFHRAWFCLLSHPPNQAQCSQQLGGCSLLTTGVPKGGLTHCDIAPSPRAEVGPSWDVVRNEGQRCSALRTPLQISGSCVDIFSTAGTHQARRAQSKKERRYATRYYSSDRISTAHLAYHSQECHILYIRHDGCPFRRDLSRDRAWCHYRATARCRTVRGPIKRASFD
jgi:hypothetical protein